MHTSNVETGNRDLNLRCNKIFPSDAFQSLELDACHESTVETLWNSLAKQLQFCQKGIPFERM